MNSNKMSIMIMSGASDWGWIIYCEQGKAKSVQVYHSSWRMCGTGGWISKNVQDTRSRNVRMILIASAAVAGTGKQL